MCQKHGVNLNTFRFNTQNIRFKIKECSVPKIVFHPGGRLGLREKDWNKVANLANFKSTCFPLFSLFPVLFHAHAFVDVYPERTLILVSAFFFLIF